LFFGADGSWSNVRIATFESKFVCKSLFFCRGWLEAGTVLCDCIQLLNKNSLWIWFVYSASASQQFSLSAKAKDEVLKSEARRKREAEENKVAAADAAARNMRCCNGASQQFRQKQAMDLVRYRMSKVSRSSVLF
jgi:hypothetical protein